MLMEIKRTQRLELERASEHERANLCRDQAMDFVDAIAILETEQKRSGA